MNARALGWVVLGVVLGFAAGQALGRRELQALREEYARLEREARASERPGLLDMFWSRLDRSAEEPAAEAPPPFVATGADAGVTPDAPSVGATPAGQGDVAVIGTQPATGRATDSTTPAAPGSAPAPELGSAPAPTTAAPNGAEPSTREERQRARGERFRQTLARFDELAAAQRVRALAARTALVTQAKLAPEQAAELDKTVEDMNGKLTGYGEEVIDQMSSEEAPSASDALGLGHDVSGILFEGQQKIDALVGEHADEVEPSAREIWNYVDLEQWKPFAAQKLAQTAAAKGTGGAGSTGGTGGTPPATPGGAGTSGQKP